MEESARAIMVCLLIGAGIIFSSCAGTRKTGSAEPKPSGQFVDTGYEIRAAEDVNQSNITVNPNKNNPSNLNLSQMIQRLPGVRWQGSGFVVDGASGSFIAGTNPLFVVNGRTIGTDFSSVNSMVDPKKVVSVSVLKGADATIYGSRGANGVILIRTVM